MLFSVNLDQSPEEVKTTGTPREGTWSALFLGSITTTGARSNDKNFIISLHQNLNLIHKENFVFFL